VVLQERTAWFLAKTDMEREGYKVTQCLCDGFTCIRSDMQVVIDRVTSVSSIESA
jgi:hypothetical protein